MTDDSDFPRLTPPDDRLTGPERLLRRPEELTDEQFDLLAAAWADNALTAESLTDMEAAIESFPARRMRAESFRKVRLVPYNDSWTGSDMLIRKSPATIAIRHPLVLTLLSAAAVIALILFWPSTARQATGTLPGTLPENTVVSEALIPEASPVIITRAGKERTAVEIAELNPVLPESARNGDATVSGPDMETGAEAMNISAIEPAEAVKAIPVTASHAAEASLMTAIANRTDLRPVEMKKVSPARENTPAPAEVLPPEKETNWVFRSISALAKAITKEEKSIDGYVVANACVNGLNNFLGWDMELKQASSPDGEPVAVNFSSSLISVTAPVNKNSP